VLDVTGLSNSDWSFNIKIFVRFIGIMFIPADESDVDFVIYDWVSGDLIMVFFSIFFFGYRVFLIQDVMTVSNF
jgi:hypothetical protein